MSITSVFFWWLVSSILSIRLAWKVSADQYLLGTPEGDHYFFISLFFLSISLSLLCYGDVVLPSWRFLFYIAFAVHLTLYLGGMLVTGIVMIMCPPWKEE